jgi:hypothetical protein
VANFQEQLSEALEKKRAAISFGVLHSSRAEFLDNDCSYVANYYTLHLLQNPDGDAVCVANIHLPHGSAPIPENERYKTSIDRLNEILKKIETLRPDRRFDKVVIGGDLGISLLSGAEEKVKDGTKVRSNIKNLIEALSAHTNFKFMVSLPTEVYRKEREPDNLIRNHRAMEKPEGEVFCQESMVFISAEFGGSIEEKGENVRVYRGEREYFADLDDSFFMTENSIKYDLLENFGHQIMRGSAFGLTFAFTHVPTTAKDSDVWTKNPYAEGCLPSEDLQRRWTQKIKEITRKTACSVSEWNTKLTADEALCISTEQEMYAFIKIFLTEVEKLPENNEIRALVNSETEKNLSTNSLRTRFFGHMFKQLNSGGMYQIYNLVSLLSTLLAYPSLDCFTQEPGYYDALSKRNRDDFIDHLETVHAEIINHVLKETDVVFLEGCRKDHALFKKAKQSVQDTITQDLVESVVEEFCKKDFFHYEYDFRKKRIEPEIIAFLKQFSKKENALSGDFFGSKQVLEFSPKPWDKKLDSDLNRAGSSLSLDYNTPKIPRGSPKAGSY